MRRILQLLNIGATVSPATRLAIGKLLDELAADAAKTPGSADDDAIRLLSTICLLLGIYG